jgi:hypothetical protein
MNSSASVRKLSLAEERAKIPSSLLETVRDGPTLGNLSADHGVLGEKLPATHEVPARSLRVDPSQRLDLLLRHRPRSMSRTLDHPHMLDAYLDEQDG